MELGAPYEYDDRMDKECVPLCDALNALPGIRTIESCCGHGQHSFRVYFLVDGTNSMQGLFFLTRCVDRRYWEYGGSWDITLSVADVVHDGILPTVFCLSSGTAKGQEAYDQVSSLIDNMNHHLNHANFIKEFGINLDGFVVSHWVDK